MNTKSGELGTEAYLRQIIEDLKQKGCNEAWLRIRPTLFRRKMVLDLVTNYGTYVLAQLPKAKFPAHFCGSDYHDGYHEYFDVGVLAERMLTEQGWCINIDPRLEKYRQSQPL